MYGVPQAGLTVPAVAGQLERGVRPHSALAGPEELSLRSWLANDCSLKPGLVHLSKEVWIYGEARAIAKHRLTPASRAECGLLVDGVGVLNVFKVQACPRDDLFWRKCLHAVAAAAHGAALDLSPVV